MGDGPTGENASFVGDTLETLADRAPYPPARGRILWQPSAEDIEGSTITALIRWLAENRTLKFDSYAELWEWSVHEPEQFWSALWDYFEIEATTPYETIFQGSTIQDTRWFPGARLNFAQHLLRHEHRFADRAALICHAEDGGCSEWSWSQLGDAVRRLATALRAMGIQPGDRVAGYLPNIAEAAVAMLATAAIGAIWSSCSPEFGATATIDRFSQIEPRLLFAVSHYRYAGKGHDRRAILNDIVAALPSIDHVVLIDSTVEAQTPPSESHISTWAPLLATPAPPSGEFQFEPVAADHPLWIVYTSGTSGPPKAIVHNHIGALLGTMKDLNLHNEVTDASRLFFYCTTSWIVWNLLLGGLSLGATVVLYDGSPFHPEGGRLWSIVEKSEVTVFVTSPAFISRMIDKNYIPIKRHALGRLEILVLAGAVAENALYEWAATALPQNTRVVSQAGSTEICGGYAGGVRLLPIRAGEITARTLGMNVDAFDADREPVRDQPGELIIRSPFPNAPQCLWNDPSGTRFYDAYLSELGGLWRQGDTIIIYSDGSCRVTGRSDATINRRGVRIGTNDIYHVLTTEPEIANAITISPQSGAFSGQLMLFVQVAAGGAMHHRLRERIIATIADGLSPRHVPDVIVSVPAIPCTATGKRLEVPLRHLFEMPRAPQQFALSLQHDPDTASWYTAYAQERVG